MGMAFAFAWTPCIGPVLAVVLGLAEHNGSLAGGVLLLFAYSLGLAVPFLLAGTGLRPPHLGHRPGPARAYGSSKWSAAPCWSSSASCSSPITWDGSRRSSRRLLDHIGLRRLSTS